MAPDWVWSEAALVDAARLIRRYHDLCRGFQPPADARWQVMVGGPAGGDVICHNDLAPFNTVFRQGTPVAFLDWDLAAPGPPLWDVAYAAWRFVPLYSDPAERGWPTGIAERAARLRSFCDAYGLASHDRARLVGTIERRIRCSLDTGEAWGRSGKPGWAEIWREESHRQGTLQTLAYVGEHRHALEAALA